MPPKRDRPTGGTPPYKKAKDKDKDVSESSTMCITCDKLVDDNGFLCESCYQWEHNRCVGTAVYRTKPTVFLVTLHLI